MEKPIRVQRKRTRGFKLPPNTVCVTRGTKYGNPFIVGKYFALNGLRGKFELINLQVVGKPGYEDFVLIENNDMAVTAFENYLKFDFHGKKLAELIQLRLPGKNIACFCALNKSCHADVILNLANNEQ